MKKLFVLTALTGMLFTSLTACAQQDKSKRPSPPAKVSETIASGATITIDYSQPALKGRTIGKDIEPMQGKVWRAGANEATVFEVSKDVTIAGKALPAGKYGFYAINNGKDFTLILSKKWNQWGTVYNEAEDALRVVVPTGTTDNSMERLTYAIDAKGNVALTWGTLFLTFQVK